MKEIRKTPPPPDWCDADPASISAERAQQLIADAVAPVVQVETVAVRAALGRIAAVDVKSAVQVPNHTNSAMDGYALAGRSCPAYPKRGATKKSADGEGGKNCPAKNFK